MPPCEKTPTSLSTLYSGGILVPYLPVIFAGRVLTVKSAASRLVSPVPKPTSTTSASTFNDVGLISTTGRPFRANLIRATSPEPTGCASTTSPWIDGGPTRPPLARKNCPKTDIVGDAPLVVPVNSVVPVTS